MAGFEHVGVIEIDAASCETLRINRPNWNVIQQDVRSIDGTGWRGITLLAGGVPCPPFSIASKQLGPHDERDLFSEALRLVGESRPLAVLLENVRGLTSARFTAYRQEIVSRLNYHGYEVFSRIINASDYGVPQLRPRFILVALQERFARTFWWPVQTPKELFVGGVLADLMSERGWPGATIWKERVRGIAPTLVGGSKKHGGPDLDPTRARNQWATALGVDGLGIADEAPGDDFPAAGFPRLTLRMAARLQGFSDDWRFAGKKTAAYRQIGNAFPPPVALAIGKAILAAVAEEDAGFGAQLKLMEQRSATWSV